MKLLIATDRDFWKADIGSRKRISKLCSYLAGTCCEVYLFLTFGGANYTPDEIERIRLQYGFKTVRLYVQGRSYGYWPFLKGLIKPKLISIFRPTSDSGNHERVLSEFRSPEIKKQFDQFVTEIAPDYILVEYIRLAYLIDPLPSGIKTLIDTHDVMHLRYESFNKAGKPHWLKISKKEEVEVLNQFDAVLAIQEREKEYFRSILGKNTSILHVGMDILTESLQETPDNCLSIGFIGAHGDPNIEGISYFTEKIWVPFVKTNKNKVKLIIAGSICDVLAQRKPSPEITLLGTIEDVRDFYRQTAIIINPVTFGGGLKIKTVEALAYGKPLVCTPAGALGLEDGANSAFLVAENEQEFLTHLTLLAESADARRALGNRALAYAKDHFSAECVYRELIDFLAGPVAGRS